MLPALLDSRLATLQEPSADEHPLTLDIAAPAVEMGRQVLAWLHRLSLAAS